MNKVILIGFFIETYELCLIENFDVIGVVDRSEKVIPENIQLTYFGNDDLFLTHDISWAKKANLVLTPDNPKIRQRLHHRYYKFKYVSIISKDAIISNSAKLGIGITVQSQCHISSNCIIGSFVKINIAANIMHDNIIGDYSTIAPNAVLLGGVKVGKLCYIGANSTILPGITIGDNSIVGAGSVITKNVPPNSVYYGVPARKYGENK